MLERVGTRPGYLGPLSEVSRTRWPHMQAPLRVSSLVLVGPVPRGARLCRSPGGRLSPPLHRTLPANLRNLLPRHRRRSLRPTAGQLVIADLIGAALFYTALVVIHWHGIKRGGQHD